MKRKKTGLIGIIITAVVLVIVVIISNLGTSQMKVAQTVVNKLFMPFQNGYVFIKNKITGNEQQLSDLEILKNENSALREENTKLKEQVRELEILKSENNTLKEYLLPLRCSGACNPLLCRQVCPYMAGAEHLQSAEN